MTGNGTEARIDKLMELVVAYGQACLAQLPPGDRASYRAAIEAYARAVFNIPFAQPSRSQALRAAGFTARPRMTGAGGLIREEFKDESDSSDEER